MTTGWASIDNALQALGLRFGSPTAAQTTGGGHAPDSLHYAGLARDYGDANSDVSAITNALVPYATGAGAPIAELFSSRDGVFLKNGAPFVPDGALRQDHYDHVHVGLRSGVDLASIIAGGSGPAQSATLVGASSGPGIGGAGSILAKTVFLLAGVGLVVLGAKHMGRDQ